VGDRAGADRLRPSITSYTWSVRAPLADWLRSEAARARETRDRYRVLDVGCGAKPYAELFADAEAYVGLDIGENAAADVTGSVESIPLDDESFDIVLCNQVLEHAADPARAVRELHRVATRGGRVLASTHGVQVYHPAPDDLWRWTHAGLERLFRENGTWSELSVTPGAGTAACLAMLGGLYIDLLAKRLRARPVGGLLVAGLNKSAAAIDRRSRRLREPGPGTLFANFHVVAVKE
jgi:SAM-dependent methyltransferase